MKSGWLQTLSSQLFFFFFSAQSLSDPLEASKTTQRSNALSKNLLQTLGFFSFTTQTDLPSTFHTEVRLETKKEKKNPLNASFSVSSSVFVVFNKGM